MSDNDIAYYTLPVILSFEGVEKQISSKLGKAFGDVGKKSSKALADATEDELKRASDSYDKLRNKALDALGKVRVEEEKLAKARTGGKSDQIAAAEERLAKARRDAATVNRDALRSYSDLESIQGRLSGKTSGLGMEFGKLGDLAGKAGTALASAGVVAAGAATVGIAALAAGVIAAGRELYNLGQQWDDVTDALSVKTAKIGPDLDKLKTAVKDLAPATASSIGDIGSAVGAVSQALRLSGSDLTKVSKTILDLNRITGEDLNIRDLGKVFRGFGVDAKNQVATLDSLYRASAATGMSVNDLVSAIGSNGPALRTMGMGVSEGAALMAVFNEAGLDGEKALAALGLAAKNLAKDGKAPAEGLRDTLTQVQGLLAAGREADAINVATKIFGKGYGPVLDAIRSGALDAQSLNDALAQGGVTIDEVAQSTADWSERWQQLKNTLSVALEPIASGVFNLINARLEGLADWVTQNQSKVIGFFGAVADWAFAAAEAIVKFVADSLRGLGELISNVSGALGPIFDAMATIGGVAKFIPGFQNVGDAMEKIGKAGQTIDDAFAGMPGSLNKAADALEGKVLPGIRKGRTYAELFIERTKQATRFTEVLGDTVATINDNGDIVLSDNSPEVQQRLADLGIAVKEMPDGTLTVSADTAEATTILDSYRDQQEGTPIEVPLSPDTGLADKAIADWKAKLAGDPVNIPVTGGLVGVPVPGSGPVGNGPLGVPQGSHKFAAGGDGAYGLPKGSAISYGSQGFPSWVYQVADTFGMEASTYSGHQEGSGQNRGIDWRPKGLSWSSPEGAARMQRFAEYLRATGAMEQVIYQNAITGTRVGAAGGKPVGPGTDQPQYYANDWAGHRDHIHTRQSRPIPLPGGRQGAQMFSGNSVVRPMNFGPDQVVPVIPIKDPATGDVVGLPVADGATGASLGASIDTSGLYTADPGIVSAGAGTPGTNEYGEPGYYRPDPKRVRDSQQRVDDAQESIRQADAAAAQARARLAELPYDSNESAKLSAQEGVRSAEARAAKARREAADAAADLAETRKGEFTAAKQGGKSGGGSASQGGGMGAGGGLGGVGSIFGSFLKDTFGIGDWLPALDNLWPLQAADTLMSAFMPLGVAAANGELGIQTPGWYPGMSEEEFTALKGGQTSAAPFGIPDIAAPPMPANGQHAGGGAPPGPAPVVNVDQSQNFNNSPLGWDPGRVNKERDRNIQRAPRLPVGMGSS